MASNFAALALSLYSAAHTAPVSISAGILGLLSVGLAAILAFSCGCSRSSCQQLGWHLGLALRSAVLPVCLLQQPLGRLVGVRAALPHSPSCGFWGGAACEHSALCFVLSVSLCLRSAGRCSQVSCVALCSACGRGAFVHTQRGFNLQFLLHHACRLLRLRVFCCPRSSCQHLCWHLGLVLSCPRSSPCSSCHYLCWHLGFAFSSPCSHGCTCLWLLVLGACESPM